MSVDLTKEKLLFARQSGGPLRVLNCFPNTYEVGMASLGFQSIFKLFASSNKTHTTRFFTDFSEADPRGAHLITFSISWELDFFNLLDIFKQLDIPILAKERGPEHPIILGGGPVLTANPEPWADFFDLVSVGDSEPQSDFLIDEVLNYWNKNEAREKRDLKGFLNIPGIYVPTLNNQVERQKSKTNQLQSSSVITSESCWPDVGLLEVVRSCPEMCRFCLASYLSLPFRAPELEGDLIPKVEELLKYTYDIGLLGASVTQHPEFIDLLQYLKKKKESERPDLKVQVASVRASTVSAEICELLAALGVKNLTIAIESGSQRLRDIINKKLPEEYIFSSAKYAHAAGIKQIKLYGMVGLPHETEKDIDETIDLLIRLKNENKGLKIVWGCSVFTPKAQTPFQHYGVDENAEKKLKKIIKALRPKGIEVREESFKWAQVQALISRGDRSINDILIRAYQSGKTGFAVYKKLMEPAEYKHFVFNDWQENSELPWKNLMTEKQTGMLSEHKAEALELSS